MPARGSKKNVPSTGNTSSNSPSNGKMLPKTPYVASACYRSNIFDMATWENSPPNHTWTAEVQKLSTHLDLDIRRLLITAADNVDRFEELLQAKGQSWSTCGLGEEPATKINMLSPIIQGHFLTTHLLDVLVWSFLNEDTNTRLKFYDHPKLDCPLFLPPSGLASHFLSLDDDDVQQIVQDFNDLFTTIYPSYKVSRIPSPHLIEVGDSQDQDGGVSGEGTVQVPDDPRLWENADVILGHMSTAGAAVSHRCASHAHMISSNMWILVMSLMFVLNTNEPNYATRFQQAIQLSWKIDVDMRVKEILLNAMDTEKRPRRIIIAALALCQSPVFVLNKDLDLMDFKYSNPQFTLSKILPSVFCSLPATSQRSVACEKVLWRYLGRLITFVRNSEQVGTNALVPRSMHEVVDVQLGGLGMEMLKAIEEDGSHRQSTRSPWPSPVRCEVSQNQENLRENGSSGDGVSGGGTGGGGDIDRGQVVGAGSRSGNLSSSQGNDEGEGPSNTQADSNLGGDTTGGQADLTNASGQSNQGKSLQKKDNEEERGGDGDDAEDRDDDDDNMEDRDDEDESDDNDDGEWGPGRTIQKKRKRAPGGSSQGRGKKPCQSSIPDTIPDTFFTEKQIDLTPWVRSLEGSRFDWVPFTEVKSEPVEGLPPLEDESDTEKVMEIDNGSVRINIPPRSSGPQTLAEEVTVLRYVILEDNCIHRQYITFPLSWPKCCEEQRQYAAALIANSRPATPQEYLTVIDDTQGAQTSNPAPAIFRSSELAVFDSDDVQVEDRQKWDKILSDKPVMFIPPFRASRHRNPYEAPILTVRDIDGTLRLDVYKERQVHDSRKFNSEDNSGCFFARASIKEVVESNRRAVNMLDIPNPTLSPPSIIQNVALETVGARSIQGTGFPANSMRWNLCATQPALTYLHYDAGRMATWMRCLRGTKIWFILEGPLPENGLAEVDVAKSKFIYFVVEERSLLVMPPGTPHAALNVTDCIAEGGHMFLASSLTKSLQVGLREHVLGHQDTNTVHVCAESLLHSILEHYELAIRNFIKMMKAKYHGDPGGFHLKFEQVRECTRFFPSLENFAALLAMCGHPNAFEPALPKGHSKAQASLSLYRERLKSQDSIKTVLPIPQLWQPFTSFENQIEDSQPKIDKQTFSRFTSRSSCRPIVRYPI